MTVDALLKLLPGLGAVLLALLGGVVGSMLLELWWKPRRTRRRIAALLVEEVNLNAQMIQNYIHVLRRDPGSISPDFELSRLALDAVAQDVGELPPTVAGHVILAYHHFECLPRLLEILRERNRRWREAEGATGRSDVEELKDYTINALDVFTVALNTAFKEAGETLELLQAYAPKVERRGVSDAEYAQRVAAAEAERIERTKRLRERLEHPDPGEGT